VPVSVVASIGNAVTAYAAAVNSMPAAKKPANGPKVGVDTTISAGIAGPQVGVDTSLSAGLTRLRTVNKELKATATQTLPAAGQALGQVAEVAEQKFKAAGQYAKDVITQSEEAIRRVKFDWNAVGAGFENALQDSFRNLFSGGKFFKEVLPNAARLFGQEFARSIGDEASRQFSGNSRLALYSTLMVAARSQMAAWLATWCAAYSASWALAKRARAAAASTCKAPSMTPCSTWLR
jgi:hypothetical protein